MQHTKIISWDLQELSTKIIRGSGPSAALASPESQPGPSRESNWDDDNVLGSGDQHHAVSEADVLALLSRPPGKAPIGEFLCMWPCLWFGLNTYR